MTFTTGYWAGALCAAALVLAGCERSPSSPASETPEEQNSAGFCPAEPGRAPSGSLVAAAIPAAASQREAAGLYEGPVWIDGALYFSDFTFEEGFPSRVQRYVPGEGMSTVIEDSGSNGLAVDSQGALMAATHDAKAIARYDLATGERTLLRDQFEGQLFNSPNDLTLTDGGAVYFTDPDFQRSAAPGGQPETRVYRLSEDGETIDVVDSSIDNPNGVSLSPDERTLYVAGGGEEGVLRAYSLDRDGRVSAQRDLASVAVPDGMAVDCLGNLYVTEHTQQRVRVYSPEGEELAQIAVDANITNAAFGGPERRTLYLTGAGKVWQIQLDVAGYPY